jgi:nicotinamide mononucleotide transporter
MTELSLLGQTTSLIEVIAMLTGLAGVYLTIRQSVWCFPVGIINVALYAYIFFSPGIQLYADALLQCSYIVLLFYGWYKWSTRKESEKVILPSLMNKTVLMKVLTVILLSTIALALFLSNFTNASFPWIDSALTCASLAAQWMIARKSIENWIVWIIVNIVYVPLYLVKQLPLTAFLYAVFLLMAVNGYREWKADMNHAK